MMTWCGVGRLRSIYFIATICNPHQKGLTFPCVSQEERLESHEWFKAEYNSLWNTSAPKEPQVPVVAPAASASLPVPVFTPMASASALLCSPRPVTHLLCHCQVLCVVLDGSCIVPL